MKRKEKNKMVNESKLVELYGEIANQMDSMVPCEWKRIVLYAEELGDVSTTGFYFYTNDEQVYWSEGITDRYEVDEYEYMMQLMQLMELVKELWIEFKNADEEVWSVFTFDIDSEWKFKTNYEYELNDEISDLERRIRWAYNELDIIPNGEYGRKLLREYLVEQGNELPDELKNI